MYSLLYKSVAKADFNPEEIFKMLLKAKKYNREHEISGCILYHQGKFLQLLEGTKENIHALYAKIREDKRHEDVEILIESDCTERLWEDWSMAFYDLSGTDKEITKKRNLLEIYFNTSSLSKKSQLIFKTFKNAAFDLIQAPQTATDTSVWKSP